jgi:transcriptional regulator with XRE-family HTH domain
VRKDTKATIERWRQTVASVVKATRDDVDLTQEKLAEKLGWSRTKIANIESGRTALELGEIALIAQACNERLDVVLQRILMWNSRK